MPPHRVAGRSLRARLLAALGAMLLPLLALGAAGVVTNERTSRATDANAAAAIADMRSLDELHTDLDAAERAGHQLALTGDPAAERAFWDAGRRVERHLAALRLADERSRRELGRLTSIDWRRAKVRLPIATAGGFAAAEGREILAFLDAMTHAQNRVADLLSLGIKGIDARNVALLRAQREQLGFLMALLAVSTVFALWLFRRLYRSISRPLAELQNASRALGAGDLDRRADVRGPAEIEALGAAFNTMAGQLVEGRRRLAHQATHDPLTGLPNRRVLLERTAEAHDPAILFIDLDDFKAVNDSLGHDAGDALLCSIAQRLLDTVRPGDLVVRFGGDEFAVLLTGVREPEQAERVADRLRLALTVPVTVSGHQLDVRASVGVAVGRFEGGTLLRHADLAMYEAKAAGKDARRTFEPFMHERAVARLEVETRLRGALDRREFELHYQPLVDLADGAVLGLEALVRWRDPDRGLVPPGHFIPVAEDSGLIVALGDWILGEACAFAAAVPDVMVNVNLSARQLEAPDLCETVQRRLAVTGLDPARLVLEITETTVARDLAATAALLHRLRRLGVSIALDDFGTGYSSLGLLHHLPVDYVKIDRVFVSDLDREDAERDRALVRAMVALTDSIGARVTAEGVERETQLPVLRELGCHTAQGFHFSRPVPAGEAVALLDVRPAV